MIRKSSECTKTRISTTNSKNPNVWWPRFCPSNPVWPAKLGANHRIKWSWNKRNLSLRWCRRIWTKTMVMKISLWSMKWAWFRRFLRCCFKKWRNSIYYWIRCEVCARIWFKLSKVSWSWAKNSILCINHWSIIKYRTAGKPWRILLWNLWPAGCAI